MTNHERTNEHIEKILAQGRDFHMSTQGKSRVRETVSTYADQHPVATLSPFGNAFSFTAIMLSRRSAYVFGALFLLITMGAGTTYASESSLPGDTLYPIKVSISEPIQEALIPTVRGKAVWHTKLAERRLDEATTLAASHALDVKTGTYLAAAFNTNVDASLHAANSLEQAGDTDDATQVKDGLEATVTAHAAILWLVAESSASSTSPSETKASSTLASTIQNAAIHDIAEKVAMTSHVLVAERMKSDGVATAVLPLLPVQAALRVSGVNTASSKLSIASTTTESSSTLSISMTQPTTASNAASTSSNTLLTNESKKATIQAVAREKSRAALMSSVFERNQDLLHKLGISASTTERSNSNDDVLPTAPTSEPI